MNYHEYKLWSLKRNPNALWLGELDVFNIMSPLTAPPYHGEVSSEQVLSTWTELSVWDAGEKAVKITTGVRDGLKHLWAALQTKVTRIWIPSDVYPVYSNIIPSSHTYELMATTWLDDLLKKVGDCDAILLPTPLHPIGRNLSENESSKIIEWLDNKSEAWLLADTAYDYRGWSFPHERCITLRTMSKSWLCRQMFGLVEGRSDVIELLDSTSFHEPHLRYCYGTLNSKNLPMLQQDLFTKAWKHIQHQLRALEIELIPPATGYLTVINSKVIPRNSQIVSVPASVFGSNKSCRVISCLGAINL